MTPVEHVARRSGPRAARRPAYPEDAKGLGKQA
jgi:hypothetical protein